MATDLSGFGKGTDLSIQALVSADERRVLIREASEALLAETAKEIRGMRGEAWRSRVMLPDWARIDPDHGTVTARFDAAGVPADVVAGVLDLLRASSPVLTGRYRESHRVYADKRDVTDALPDAEKAEAIREFSIMPTVEYARKLENLYGIYEGVAAVAQHRYGNQAGVYFEFRSPLLPYIPGGRNRAERYAVKRQPSRIAAMKVERQTRVPCIFITPLGD